MNGNIPNGYMNSTNGSNHASGCGVAADTAHMNGSTIDSTTHSVKVPERGVQLLVWSARDEAALRLIIQQYTDYFDKRVSGQEEKLRRLAHTLSSRRNVMAWRAFAVVDSSEESTTISAATSTLIRSDREAGMAWIFTGQGAQYAQMGWELLRFPIFKSTMVKIGDIFRSLGAPWSLLGKTTNCLYFDVHADS